MCKKVIAKIRQSYADLNARETERIQEAAMLLLDDLYPDLDGKYPYPLPVVSLLSRLGFSLFRTTFEKREQSGLIVVDSALPEKNKVFKTNRAVLVNREDSVAHQRFTIAHEIAHYIFDYDEATQPVYYKPYFTTEKEDEVELRANRFAAELLMPTKDFCAEFEQYKADNSELFSLPNAISHLAKRFDVPTTAVDLRLGETKCLVEKSTEEETKVLIAETPTESVVLEPPLQQGGGVC